ncbi:sterol desaturase family protein [Brevibacillus porteri]|uniref:sterol desaturase family protein n=1 Tax=Brevibacillus porteri TaxID=2126350 RepID=UPI003D2120B5
MKAKFLKEFFTFPDILTMCILFLISLSFTISEWYVLETWVALVAGMIGYAASEYLIHRFLFHLKPPRNPFFLHLLKRLHYDHHADPNNLHLLFLPVWYSLPLIAGTGAICFLLTSDMIVTNAFVTGVIGFLLFYEWKHYIAHRPVQPISPWGRWMKKLHLWHHFKNEHYWYGVTSPVFDVMLGTYKNEQDVEKSSTVRDLERRWDKDIEL